MATHFDINEHFEFIRPPGDISIFQIKTPRLPGLPRGLILLTVGYEPSVSATQSDEATEADKAHTQHQQSHDGHAVLAQRWDAFEEYAVGERA